MIMHNLALVKNSGYVPLYVIWDFLANGASPTSCGYIWWRQKEVYVVIFSSSKWLSS